MSSKKTSPVIRKGGQAKWKINGRYPANTQTEAHVRKFTWEDVGLILSSSEGLIRRNCLTRENIFSESYLPSRLLELSHVAEIVVSVHVFPGLCGMKLKILAGPMLLFASLSEMEVQLNNGLLSRPNLIIDTQDSGDERLGGLSSNKIIYAHVLNWTARPFVNFKHSKATAPSSRQKLQLNSVFPEMLFLNKWPLSSACLSMSLFRLKKEYEVEYFVLDFFEVFKVGRARLRCLKTLSDMAG